MLPIFDSSDLSCLTRYQKIFSLGGPLGCKNLISSTWLTMKLHNCHTPHYCASWPCWWHFHQWRQFLKGASSLSSGTVKKHKGLFKNCTDRFSRIYAKKKMWKSSNLDFLEGNQIKIDIYSVLLEQKKSWGKSRF